MAVKRKKLPLPILVLGCAIVIAAILVLKGNKQIEEYKANYFYNSEEISIVEAEATSLGTRYEEYTAEAGNELYCIDLLLQNENIIDQYYVSVYFDYLEAPVASNGYYEENGESDNYNFGDRRLSILPAGMQSKIRWILEVPEGTKSVIAHNYIYIEEEDKQFEVLLTEQ